VCEREGERERGRESERERKRERERARARESERGKEREREGEGEGGRASEREGERERESEREPHPHCTYHPFTPPCSHDIPSWQNMAEGAINGAFGMVGSCGQMVGRTVGNAVLTGSKAGGTSNSQTKESVRLIGRSGLMAAATVLEAVSDARERVLEDSKLASGEVVGARYGDDAKDAFDKSVDSVLNVQKVQCFISIVDSVLNVQKVQCSAAFSFLPSPSHPHSTPPPLSFLSVR
jgi:hypothetical protein